MAGPDERNVMWRGLVLGWSPEGDKLQVPINHASPRLVHEVRRELTEALEQIFGDGFVSVEFEVRQQSSKFDIKQPLKFSETSTMTVVARDLMATDGAQFREKVDAIFDQAVSRLEALAPIESEQAAAWKSSVLGPDEPRRR
jgi:hypothetical protein